MSAMAAGMKRCGAAALLAVCTLSCVPNTAAPDIETQVSFLNLSRTQYAVFGIRAHGSAGPFAYTPLLAPGATVRDRFALYSTGLNPVPLWLPSQNG